MTKTDLLVAKSDGLQLEEGHRREGVVRVDRHLAVLAEKVVKYWH